MANTNAESNRLLCHLEDMAGMSDSSSNGIYYVEVRDAFFDQPLHKFVFVEVSTMMRIFFMQIPYCTSFYNPIYLLMFIALYVLTLIGAILHWMIMWLVPVRVSEELEEREFRCQGIYAAIGAAVLSLPYHIVYLVHHSYSPSSAASMMHTVSLYVDIGVILICFIGLKAITDELGTTVRVFIFGSWVCDVTLMVILICGAPLLSAVNPGAIVQFCISAVTVFISTVVAAQSTHFWDLYHIHRARKANTDRFLAGTLLLIISLTILGLLTVAILTLPRDWIAGILL